MGNKGYSSAFWQTIFFEGESHTEISWAKRLGIPVLFLLKPIKPKSYIKRCR
jgi:hypothetical protein